MTGDAQVATPSYGAARGTDREAVVSALFAAHHARLVVLAQMLVGDRATAEDVVQDAFAALYRRWLLLRDKGAALGYLQTAVVNGARTQLRRRRTEPVELKEGADAEVNPADAPLLATEEQRALSAALTELPVRQRQVVVLRYYLDQSEAEIASTLSISKGSVKKHASRALAALGQRLESSR